MKHPNRQQEMTGDAIIVKIFDYSVSSQKFIFFLTPFTT